MVQVEYLLVVLIWLAWVVQEPKLLLVLANRYANVHLPLLSQGEHSRPHSEDTFVVVRKTLSMSSDLVQHILLVLKLIMRKLSKRNRQVGPCPVVLLLGSGLRWKF